MKNLKLIFLFIFLYGCGYTSIYKDLTNQDFAINIKNMEGDLEINNLIKNQLKSASNTKSKNIHDINLTTEYKKIVTAKDTKGLATNYKITLDVEFIILSKNNQKLKYTESINIENETESFEQSNYEKNIKRNFVISIKNKLVLYLLKFNDN